MTNTTLLLASMALAGSVTISQAATVTLHLLGANNQPLAHGEATVIAKSPESGWTRYVGFVREGRYYTANLPDVDYLNIVIYTTADTSQRSVDGLYGRRNHTMYLRTDRLGYAMCRSGVTEWGMPLDLVELMDDLDAAFPEGVPARMTNVRTLLERSVLPALNQIPDPLDQELRQERDKFRARVERHLR